MTAENDRCAISESSFGMFSESHCRARGKRKHERLVMGARDRHIVMACG